MINILIIGSAKVNSYMINILLSPSSDFLLNILQLMGLAVYNSINLDVRFPPCCYKKLLSPAVVPYNNPRAVVGVANMGLKDLEAAMPVSGGQKIELEWS